MKLLHLVLLLGAHLLVLAAAKKKPNVVFIVVDDLGHDDVGFKSHDINTPNIDSLAASGLVLENYYVQDVCSPSRATFMTGRFAMHHSIVDWIPPASAYGLPQNETTMAQKFGDAGYSCHMSGKWHLGFYQWGMTPTYRGFQSFRGFYGGGEDYFTHQSSGAYDFRHDPTPKCGPNCSQIDSDSQGVYSTTVFTTEAVRVVNQHDWTDEAKPLFLYLAYQGVHSPAEVPESYIVPYEDSIADPKRRIFAGMLSAVDEGIGNVTAALRANDAFDDTLFVFTSDNGGPTTTGDGVGARNWPLRGGKHSIWDGGVRAVAFISGVNALQTNGSRTNGYPRKFNGLMHGADWLTTLASVGGYDTSAIPLPVDGVDLWHTLLITAQGEGSIGAHLGRVSADGTNRSTLVIGNSTNMCTWAMEDPRYHGAVGLAEAFAAGGDVGLPLGGGDGDLLGCGFAVRMDDGRHRWKLIQNYGGGPNTWCNKSQAGDLCGYPNKTYDPNGRIQGASSACGMALEAGVCYPGIDIRSFFEENVTACCSACTAEPGCAAFTLHTRHSEDEELAFTLNARHGEEEKQTRPKCYLKSAAKSHKITKSTSCVSGFRVTPPEPGPAPPAPESGSCPNGWCLYDVLADPYEMHEVSTVAGNAAVLAELKEQMATVLETYTEYHEDPACKGKVKYAQDKIVGKTWQPWC